MRTKLTVTLALLVVLAPLARGIAADTPSAAQIIDQLTPADAASPTRGIRLGGQPTAAQPPEGAAKSAEVNLSVPFATRSAAISPAAARILDQLGQALTSAKLAEYRFRVEGHTDTVGRPDANKALSERRAASVAQYLVIKFHVDRVRLTPVGMGEDGLLVVTGPGVANAANRRVLVVNLGR